MWQAQCGDDDGVFDEFSCNKHPYASDGELRKEYARMGEIAFIESKAKTVKEAIAANPAKYLKRIGNRCMAAFILFIPFSNQELVWQPIPMSYKRIVYPLPLIAVLIILLRHRWSPQISAAISIWLLTLIPYVLVSFYDRYAIPLFLVKLIIILHGWIALKAWWQERNAPQQSPAIHELFSS